MTPQKKDKSDRRWKKERGERGTGNGSVAGLQDMKIKLNFRFLRLRFWACPGKRQWQILLITHSECSCNSAGEGIGESVCWGWLATHTHTYVGEGMSAATWLKYKTQKECQVSLKRQNMWQFLLPHSLSPSLFGLCCADLFLIHNNFAGWAGVFILTAGPSFRLCCIPLPLALLLATNVIFLFQHSILPWDTGKTIKREICGRIKLKFNKNIIYWRKRCENEGERSENRIVLRLGVVNYGSGNIKPKFDDLLSGGCYKEVESWVAEVLGDFYDALEKEMKLEKTNMNISPENSRGIKRFAFNIPSHILIPVFPIS